ncbi:MAG TPA: methionine biosynthesis protein MetW [bacterium]|nr:methionine biosynthesis protein MetW [bacterium]HPN45054.1 methionine biosynthesis protein MetW [bacterium]
MKNLNKDQLRLDLNYIARIIENNSRVLDLGCGSGELLHKLAQEKNIRGHGVEIDVENICACVEKGVPVIHADMDEGLGEYPDKSFDYVILSQTLQAVKKPHIILHDMLRVGQTGIVSLLNFGYWKVRSQLFVQGIMPRTKTLPYQWYDTPNIHLTTIKDFKNLCAEGNITIKQQINLGQARKGGVLYNLFPNWFTSLAIFVIKKNK